MHHPLHLTLARHRRYQLVISVGIVTTTVLTLVAPEHAHYAALGNIMTNLLWIWE